MQLKKKTAQYVHSKKRNPSKQVVNFILEFSYSIKNEEYLKTSASAECSRVGSEWCMEHLYSMNWYWHPVCIWVLAVNFKAHQGLWPVIYKNISPQLLLPILSKDVFQVQLARECQLMGSEREIFSDMAPVLWRLYCSCPWWSFIKL